MLPAALRLTWTVFEALSPNTVSTPVPGEKTPVTA
jgi:hypothetical protein